MNSTKSSPRYAANTNPGTGKRADKIKKANKMRKTARFAVKKASVEKKNLSRIASGGDNIGIEVIQLAGRNAASRAMKVMGYVVVQEGNKIVKRYRDGRIDELEDLGKESKLQKVSFD
jgi:hypothetical protein